MDKVLLEFDKATIELKTVIKEIKRLLGIK